MEERQFRNKIYWLTFLFSVLVIWVHSFNAELFLGPEGAGTMAGRYQRFLSEDVGQIAVPGFFMISSYLFYRNFDLSKLIPKWKSRVRSILIPYLLWNFIYYMGYVAATRVPGISGIVGKPPVPFNIRELFSALILYSYNPVFWYLYQLLILIGLSPAIYLVFKRTGAGAVALGLMVLALWKNWNFPQLNMDALFYTCAASYVSLNRNRWREFTGGKFRGRRGLYLSVAVLCFLYCVLFILGRPGSSLYARPILTVLYRLLGVCVVCLAFRFIPLPEAREWMKHNFFLYAVHFALVRLINKAGALILPPSPGFALAVFVLMPVIVVSIHAALVKGLTVWLPDVYRVLAGGR